MYQFPLFEEPLESFCPPKELIKNSILYRKTEVTHLLTHQKLNVIFWEFEMKKLFLNKKYKKIEIKNLNDYPWNFSKLELIHLQLGHARIYSYNNGVWTHGYKIFNSLNFFNSIF